ncbi:MAG: hypothetical protein JSS81_25305 [Acidobacteria bacterium]|nr:hypothetical protein [Acidobacteriota bacterium]
MKVTLKITHRDDLQIDLVDVWYKENYWTTSSNALGGTKTGPFTYNKGHRKARLWDGAGTVILEIDGFDFPPYHIDDRAVSGRAFYNVRDRPLRYGEHRWYHFAEPKTE